VTSRHALVVASRPARHARPAQCQHPTGQEADVSEPALRAERRRQLLAELEQLRRLRARAAPRKARRWREQRAHLLTRLSI
jgi:hypothetical protein